MGHARGIGQGHFVQAQVELLLEHVQDSGFIDFSLEATSENALKAAPYGEPALFTDAHHFRKAFTRFRQ